MTPRKALVALLKVPLHVYRYAISPLLGSNCRFQPTCSSYALQALDTHGAVRGTLLALRRFGKCRPGGASGYDPVPPNPVRSPHETVKTLDD